MGNKESRDNDRGRTDYSSNSRPRETAWQELRDREISRAENQPGRSVLKELVDKPEKTFLRELLDRETNRTENSLRERVSVREHARETGGDSRNDKELGETPSSSQEASKSSNS